MHRHQSVERIAKTGTDSYFTRTAVADYNKCLKEIELLTDDEIKKLLLMQTVEGHSRKGHGKFSAQKHRKISLYLNSGMEDVVEALEKKGGYGITRQDVKERRKEIIDEIYRWAEDACKFEAGRKRFNRIPERLRHLTNEEGQPLMRVPFLKEYEVKNPATVLKGIFLGSRMDNIEYRKKTMERYRGTDFEISIGGGECVALDLQKIRETNIMDIIDDYARFPDALGSKLSIDFLSANALEEYIPKMIEEGIILQEDAESSWTIRNGYVRHKVGKGVSDDLAVIIAGYNYGIDAAMGVYLIDAVDTLDKYVPTIVKGGLDEKLGTIIQKQLPNIASDNEITTFIRAIANSEHEIADSSQRRFLQVYPEFGKSAIESHIEFIKTGRETSGMLFGFDEIISEKFYEKASERIKLLYKIR